MRYFSCSRKTSNEVFFLVLNKPALRHFKIYFPTFFDVPIFFNVPVFLMYPFSMLPYSMLPAPFKESPPSLPKLISWYITSHVASIFMLACQWGKKTRVFSWMKELVFKGFFKSKSVNQVKNSIKTCSKDQQFKALRKTFVTF